MTDVKSAGSLDGMSMPTIKPASTYTGFNGRYVNVNETHIAEKYMKEHSAHGCDHILPWITRFCSDAN